MSLSKAQNWLKNHSDSIPALNINHQNIIELLETEKNAQDIVLHAAADPGLSLAILKKINVDRGSNSSKDIVESTKSAIALLGNQVSYRLLREHSIAEQELTDSTQLFLFHQIINRSFHNEVQVGKWAKENGYQNIEQLQTCALLSYSGEALCCLYDFELYLKYIMNGSVTGEEQKSFGFSFSQLTEALCIKLNLPKIFMQALTHKESHEQRDEFLYFIAKLCHQCEHGWYTEFQLKTYNEFAEFLQSPTDLIIYKFHQVSVEAARQSKLADAWQPASRLLLIKDKAWIPAEPVVAVVQQEPVQTVQAAPAQTTITKTQPKAPQDDIFIRLKLLLKQQNVSKTDILNTCINGLFEDFSMSRVSLLMLSQNKQKLNNRMSKGIPKDSAFHQYQIETAKSGILKILLNKPQAIWINPDSLKKYQQLIPPSLLASIMTDNFLAMSLFIGPKPVGILYADRSDTDDNLDEKAFKQFKQLITLSSKALTYLSNK